LVALFCEGCATQKRTSHWQYMQGDGDEEYMLNYDGRKLAVKPRRMDEIKTRGR